MDGKEIDVIQNLAIDTIFKDSKKGTHASRRIPYKTVLEQLI